MLLQCLAVFTFRPDQRAWSPGAANLACSRQGGGTSYQYMLRGGPSPMKTISLGIRRCCVLIVKARADEVDAMDGRPGGVHEG